MYDYSGISLDQVKDGDWVVVEGILFRNDTSSPYTSRYYLRPTQQNDIEVLSSSTVILLSEAMRKDTTPAGILLCIRPPFLSFLIGQMGQRAVAK